MMSSSGTRPTCVPPRADLRAQQGTEKAIDEHGFGTIKDALAPILALLDPPRRRGVTVRAGRRHSLLVLRICAASQRHLGHPLDGCDPELLRVIVEE